MDNVKNDSYYVHKIHEDLAFIVKHTRNIDAEELYANEVLLDSMMFRLVQISENAKRLSDDYKSSHSAIPWTAISGLRNKIVHDYGSVDQRILTAPDGRLSFACRGGFLYRNYPFVIPDRI